VHDREGGPAGQHEDGDQVRDVPICLEAKLLTACCTTPEVSF
jgi:hypothetical protein